MIGLVSRDVNKDSSFKTKARTNDWTFKARTKDFFHVH